MSFDHQWAETRLTGRCKNRRKMANHTYLERREGGDIALKLHDTDIATYHDDGTVELHSGGWLTPTTKERLNRFTDARISQTQGIWSLNVHLGNESWAATWDRPSVGWAEGVTLHPSGEITGFLPATDEQARTKRNSKMRRDVREFVKSITAEQIVTQFENTGGDCFICRFSKGQPNESPSCLASHVSAEERYFHASLAYNAVAGSHHNPDVVMSMIWGAAKNGRISELLTRALGKYLRKNLLEGVATA